MEISNKEVDLSIITCTQRRIRNDDGCNSKGHWKRSGRMMKPRSFPLHFLDRALFPIANRKVTVAVSWILIGLLIIDLLSSRQSILKFNDSLETLYFILTVTIGWGVASWLLLGYTSKATADLRAKSPLIALMHFAVTIIQFALLAVLLYVMFNRSFEFLTQYVFAITAIASTVILGIFSIKFFSWFRSSQKKLVVLLFGLATVGLAFAIATDFVAKTFWVQVTEEKSPPGVVPEEKFPFKDVEQGRILAQDIGPETTKTYLVPNEFKQAYSWYTGLIPNIFSFLFRWAAASVALRQYHHKMGKITFWCLISLPMIFYLIGRAPDIFELPEELWHRIIYRIGSNGGNVMFGIALFIVAKNLQQPVRDYLSIAGIGFAIIGIAFGIIGLQQTFGVAGHALVLLSAYLFTVGLYSTAISISHDSKLRQSIRKSLRDQPNLLASIGDAQMEQEIIKKVMITAKDNSKIMKAESGVQSSFGEQDVSQYLNQIITEFERDRTRSRKNA